MSFQPPAPPMAMNSSINPMFYNITMLNASVVDMYDEIMELQARIEEQQQLPTRLWRLAAAFFVFLMQLGFSLIEAGTVRYKNTRNIMIKNVLDTCISGIAFWLLGYALGFGYTPGAIGDFIGSRYETTGQYAFAGNGEPLETFFQFVFCATSATIFAGAVAERTHIIAYLQFNFFLAAVIYPIVAHIIWSRHGLLSAEAGRVILGTNGVIDNAGSMVVHVTGGVTSLVGAWMVGPRIGRYDIDGRVVPFKCHSMVFIASGTIVLWVGFYGFNGGSVFYQGQGLESWVAVIAHVCLNTTISAATAGITVYSATYRRKEPNPEDTFNGVIGGLVAACATSSVVEPWAVFIIGVISGGFYLGGVWVVHRFKIDDPVSAVPVHLFCGSWGAVAAGLFAVPNYVRATYNFDDLRNTCGLFYGCGGGQLLVQIIGLLTVYLWVGSSSLLLFYILHFFGVLRVKRHEEEVGLDVAFHGGEEDEGRFEGEGESERGAQRLSAWNRLRQLSSILQGDNGEEEEEKLSAGLVWRKGLGAVVGAAAKAKGVAKGGAIGGAAVRRDVWQRSLESTAFGPFSLSMYEANYVMEDTAEVRSTSKHLFLAVHDGHNGSEASEIVREMLYSNVQKEMARSGNDVSVEVLHRAFQATDQALQDIVKGAFDESPHLATVGACSIVVMATKSALWTANCGDCRAVLGQVRKLAEGVECRAVQLSEDHNLGIESIREKFREEHADMPDAVTERRGRFRVKGKVTVTRAFGDFYLKSSYFNREPLVSRFRVPEPFNPPLLTAEPHISVRIISPHDSFVIVASDGLFEQISNQEAVEIVAAHPRKDIARHLIRTALHRAAEKMEISYDALLRMPSGQRREYHDDITVVVFFLDHDALRKDLNRKLFNREVSVKGGGSLTSRLLLRNGASADVANISSVRGSSFSNSTSIDDERLLDRQNHELLSGSTRGPSMRTMSGITEEKSE